MNAFKVGMIDNNEGSYFFAYMGVVASLVFANIGAAYGTAKIGIAICTIEMISFKQMMKSFCPIVISGVLGIYGLIISVILSAKISQGIDVRQGYSILASGLVCGLSSLVAGIAIGLIGDAGVRQIDQQGKSFGKLIILLIFAEALGLYGLIIALMIA